MSNKAIGVFMFMALGIGNMVWLWSCLIINSIKAKEWNEIFWVHAVLLYIIVAIYFLCT
jgi:hypothetical protein